MQIVRLIAITVITGLLIACGETQVVIPCVAPTKLSETSGLKLGGNLSVKEAKGAIDSAIGREVRAEFASTDPNTWQALASSYQYQTCQFLNSTSCSDLPKSQCQEQKLRLLNESFEKINQEIRLERERRQAAEDKARSERQEQERKDAEKKAADAANALRARVTACIAERVGNHEAVKTVSVEGGARANSTGVGGGKNENTVDLCHAVGPNQRIVSASTEPTSCHGGRCSVSEPKITDEQRKVCVTTKAWSESNTFGAGGSGKYRLTINFMNVAGEQERARFQAACTANG